MKAHTLIDANGVANARSRKKLSSGTTSASFRIGACLAFLFSVIVTAATSPSLRAAAANNAVSIGWLGGDAPSVPAGVSWGVPWPRGAVKKEQAFSLTSADGKTLPLQTWPLAYWPDGSLKWSGFATVAAADGANGAFNLAPATDAAAPSPATANAATVKVTESDTTVEIDTGVLKTRIVKWGRGIIDSMSIDGREVARDGQLVCIVQDGPGGDEWETPARTKYVGRVEKLTVEQSGPVRAVVKLEGKHKSADGAREWLPFVVRLYFYAGQQSVRMVHTIVYDGDEQKDFVRGLGVTFAVPMREEIQNRHVRFSGEDSGLWSEPIQPMVGRGGRFVSAPGTRTDVYPEQLEGKRVPNADKYDARSRSFLADWAVWDDFKLVQPNPDGFTIVKRTNPQSAWISSGAGTRASGLVFAGDVSGGLAVSLKNFWQSYPASLEVRHASAGAAELRVWMWSPDAPAMDMRHYDTRAHGLEAVYEDVQPGLSTPVGVARTSELMLFATADVPSKADTVKLAQAGAQPPVLVCTPQYLHSVHALGIWSLPDRSTPFKKAIEDRLDATLDYYEKQIAAQHWYGFWDFGDVMHSYDDDRHVWRYDLGGMAWDNTELGTDMWLWVSFLRSGRADIFRMAEAMTRHTSEVDTYHLGPLAGLGSRHNVRHWGCGAKEARISQAGMRRYFYYLTTDERTGDIMHEVVNVDYRAMDFDPMRLAQPITEAEAKYPARVRAGPDWLAFVGNWMTEWERTGDTKWRDKILAGVESFKAMPYWFRSGKNLVYGYDPHTGKLFQVSDALGSYNLATIQGGAEVVFQLNAFLGSDDWEKIWLQYCRMGGLPNQDPAVILRDKQTGNEGADASLVGEQGANSQGTARLAAYVYYKTKNAAFAKRAIAGIVPRRGPFSTQHVAGPDVLNAFDEAPFVGTNGSAQSGLTAIEVLEMCADQLPTDLPPPAETASRNARGGR